MSGTLSDPDPQLETIAELRALYRAAEARAARLRLLSIVGAQLAKAESETIADSLDRCALRLAHFVGSASAKVSIGESGAGIAILAPGPPAPPVGRIAIDGLTSPDAIPDGEDRDAFRLNLEMMGATIDRINRERERMRLLEALKEREARLEHVVGQIFTAQEEERRRVSHELHDGVAQTATALARLLEGSGQHGNVDLAASERQRLAAIARALVTELRQVIGGLRPTLLDDLGLRASLGALADALSEQGYAVKAAIADDGPVIKPTHETALFRVAQEAIANIVKHAGGPCAVELELRFTGDGALPYLRIEDFGNGVAPQAGDPGRETPGSHIGIDVMRERMAAVGGTLDWHAAHAGGVCVIARFAEAA